MFLIKFNEYVSKKYPFFALCHVGYADPRTAQHKLRRNDWVPKWIP